MSLVQIDVIDILKKPAMMYSFLGPFKALTYRANEIGQIIFMITRDLANYDANQANNIVKLRKVILKIYQLIDGNKVCIREMDAFFKHYTFDERPQPDGTFEHEEMIMFEVTKIY